MSTNSRPLVYRASYTLTNALRWKFFFDAALETDKEQILNFKKPTDPGYIKEASLKNRVTDGFKWLCDNDITDFLDEKGRDGLKLYTPEQYRVLCNLGV